jgi:plastocyanin
MRSRRLLLPLTVTLALGLASPAMAVDWTVEVVDFEFKPGPRKISVGDTVIWNFTDEGHTTTAVRGQADTWNSGPATNTAGTSYQQTFNTPGRFQYVCIPHEPFMKGTIEVGEDAEKDTFDKFKGTRRGGKGAKVTFELNEAATVTYRLKGPSKRTVQRGRLQAGKYSFRLKKLKPGKYKGTLTMVDDFDKKATATSRFVVP